MNGAESVLSQLEEHGIDTIFGYPGGCIMPLYDALLNSPLSHYLCRHEQAAALAADGYARASGKIGVCVATSGPGATNLITGVANAYLDSVPMLVITGQVASSMIGTDAFQEADILGMTLGIVKHSWLVESANELAGIVNDAITLATSGRPGPVWIDIPKDVLLQTVDESLVPAPTTAISESDAPATDFGQVLALLRAAQRPLIYSGGGIIAADAVTEFRQFATTMDIPQVVTLKGIGNGDPSAPELQLGMLGMHGSRAANEAVADCDLLLAIGARFDDRATGKADTFAAQARVIHFDVDASELNKNCRSDCHVIGDLKHILPALTGTIGRPLAIDPWRQICKTLKREKSFSQPASPDLNSASQILGPTFLSQLDRMTYRKSIVCCDVGQHQMWVAQYMSFSHPRHHLSSGGLGTMGYGLPAAMGAQIANPNQQVINISGDGSVMMNIQELATLNRYAIPIKVIVLDNQVLGMVRQQQELFYGERYSQIALDDNPDFAQLAEVFGLKAFTLKEPKEIDTTLKQFLNVEGSALLHVHIAPETNVWPMVPPGADNQQMLEEELTQ